MLDVEKDVCPLLHKVELPSNAKYEDGRGIPNHTWAANASAAPVCLYQEDSLPIGWFQEQLTFLRSLTPEDRALLQSYTRNGDEVMSVVMKGTTKSTVQELMNIVSKLKTPTSTREYSRVDLNTTERIRRNYADGPLEVTERENIFAPTPLETITEANVLKVASDYVSRFKKLMGRVPPVKTPFRVFRGVAPEDNTIKVFPLRGFSSTTYDPFTTSLDGFTDTTTNCCVMDITLQPGVRALWIEPISHFEVEREILVDATSVTTEIDKNPAILAIARISPSGTAASRSKPVSMNVFKCSVKPKSGFEKFFGFGGMYWPDKYHRGLTRRQNAQRKRSATRRARMSWKDPKAYVPWKTDKDVKTRRSSYSSRFHAKYPGVKTLPEIAKATGVSLGTLRTVYNRGMAAWRTGHRPGASEHAWGMARVHSFVLHGKTWRTADADLSRQK